MTFVEEETLELEILAGRGAGPCFLTKKEIELNIASNHDEG
jgi:hypothetical protein